MNYNSIRNTKLVANIQNSILEQLYKSYESNTLGVQLEEIEQEVDILTFSEKFANRGVENSPEILFSLVQQFLLHEISCHIS